jgi:hypothetical protein
LVILLELLSIFAPFTGLRWIALYRGSDKALRVTAFHERCHGKENALTIILTNAQNSDERAIFGASTRVA